MKGEVSLVVMDAGLRQPAERLAAALSAHLPQTDIKVAYGSAPVPRGLPLLTYAKTADNSAAQAKKFIADTQGKCCVVVDVYEDFPFIESLRQRARAALGEMEVMEVSAKGGSAAQLQKVAEKLKPMVVEQIEQEKSPPPAAAAALASQPVTASAVPVAVKEQEVKPTPPPAPVAKAVSPVAESVTPAPADKPADKPAQVEKPAPPPVEVVKPATPPTQDSHVASPASATPSELVQPKQEIKPASSAPADTPADKPAQVAKPVPPPVEAVKPATPPTQDSHAASPASATPSESVQPKQEIKPASSAPADTPADKPAQVEKPAPTPPTAAEQEIAPQTEDASSSGKIDLLALAKELDFPLLEVYEHLAQVLPQPTPNPLKDSIESTYSKIQKILKVKSLYKEVASLDRGLTVCLLLLADKSIKSGEEDPTVFLTEAHKLIDSKDDELRPLQQICTILLTQLYIEKDSSEAEDAAMLLEEIVIELSKEFGIRYKPVLHAAALGALMNALQHTPHKAKGEECGKQYKEVLSKLTEPQRIAIGASGAKNSGDQGAHEAVGAVREKIGDVL